VNRAVLAWRLSNTLDAALVEAISRYEKPGISWIICPNSGKCLLRLDLLRLER
jgi:hypothetical protein